MRKKGFTLIELITTIAIIAVLLLITVPIMNGIIEKSANVTDGYNAKEITNAIKYYFTDPEHLETLKKECNRAGSTHQVQISVAQENASISPILAPALKEAGLIDAVGKTRYTEITCKSKDNWNGYYIIVHTDGSIMKFEYFGHTGTGAVHTSHSWGYYYPNNPDTSGFNDMMQKK